MISNCSSANHRGMWIYKERDNHTGALCPYRKCGTRQKQSLFALVKLQPVGND